MAHLAALQSVLAAQLVESAIGERERSSQAEGGRLLTVEEAAAKLGVARDWLYRRSGRLPFTVRLGRSLRFSEAGMDRWIRNRNGK